FIDDSTGAEAPPLDAEVTDALKSAGLPLVTPARLQPAGTSRIAGVLNPNSAQQQYFIEVTTRVVLPLLQKRGKPFVLLYWSRDPDGTQHNQGDSLNVLIPGINGPTSRAAVRNADDNLRQILEFVRSDPQLAANTDVFVTSDHGFATISKHDIDPEGHATASLAADARYPDVPEGYLPPGFLAIDLSRLLHEPLYDSDRLGKDAHGNPIYQRVTQHPGLGNGIIGGTGAALDQTDAKVTGAAAAVEHRAARQRATAASGDGPELQDFCARSAQRCRCVRPIAERRADRRYLAAAGPRHAWQLWPRQHL